MRRLREGVLRATHPFEIVRLEGFLRFAERVVDRLALSFPELRSVLAQRALRPLSERMGRIRPAAA